MFEDDESRFVVMFLCHLRHVVYSGWKLKATIWLVNIISTEHDQ